MTFEQALQMIATGALILGSTWKLSSQISSISTKLDEHCRQDEARFKDVESDLNTIAPRIVRLPNRRN
jgi:hypothetical protein